MKISEYATMFLADLVFFTAFLIKASLLVKNQPNNINNLSDSNKVS
jgi:hypothetical protein